MTEPQETCQCMVVRTPNPMERAVMLWVPEKFFSDDTVTTPGTELQDFMPLADKADAIQRGYGGYLMTDSCDADPGYLGFYFAQPKTAKQRQKPFRTKTTRELYYWPPWMRALYAVTDPNTPIAVQTPSGTTYQNTVFDRWELISGGNYQAQVVQEEFTSPEPFPPEELQCWTPQPTEVNYNYLGAQNSVSCLHEDITIPEQQTNALPVPGFGTPNAQERWAGGDFFPATNMTGWGPHPASNEQQFINGVYYRIQKTVTPLFIPRGSRMG